jgi:hypothetical protein
VDEKNKSVNELQKNIENEKETYHIHRATKFYKDVDVQIGDDVAAGCAIDSDLYTRGQGQTQRFRQMEDIVLLRLNKEELKGDIKDIKKANLVDSKDLEEIANLDGYVSAEVLKSAGINALFTDHTRIGKLDFVDFDHVASEIRLIDSYTYRHDSTTEDMRGIVETPSPTAWKLEGINTTLGVAYWESMEEYES